MMALMMRHGATRDEASDIVRALGLDTRVVPEGIPVEIMKVTAADRPAGKRRSMSR